MTRKITLRIVTKEKIHRKKKCTNSITLLFPKIHLKQMKMTCDSKMEDFTLLDGVSKLI